MKRGKDREPYPSAKAELLTVQTCTWACSEANHRHIESLVIGKSQGFSVPFGIPSGIRNAGEQLPCSPTTFSQGKQWNLLTFSSTRQDAFWHPTGLQSASSLGMHSQYNVSQDALRQVKQLNELA